MLINLAENTDIMGIRAAHLIASEMRHNKCFVLGLATGQTPLPMYRELVRRHREEKLDFSNITTFNLDEYVGLPPEDPGSYHCFMLENFFNHVNIPPKNIHIPDGMAKDIEEVGPKYEEAITNAGGIDIQVLGIGRNGHIGFNEPGSSLGSPTRTKYLSEKTRRDNSEAFDSWQKVPHEVITMGCGTILKSRHIIILASGPIKARTVKAAFEGPITTMCPASILQLHRRVTAIVTKDAASELTLPDERIPGIEI